MAQAGRGKGKGVGGSTGVGRSAHGERWRFWTRCQWAALDPGALEEQRGRSSAGGVRRARRAVTLNRRLGGWRPSRRRRGEAVVGQGEGGSAEGEGGSAEGEAREAGAREAGAREAGGGRARRAGGGRREAGGGRRPRRRGGEAGGGRRSGGKAGGGRREAGGQYMNPVCTTVRSKTSKELASQ